MVEIALASITLTEKKLIFEVKEPVYFGQHILERGKKICTAKLVVFFPYSLILQA